MDVHDFWNGHQVAAHVAQVISPHLSDDSWLLAHNLDIILVKGSGSTGRSLGSVAVAPVSGDPDAYRECLERVLDDVRELVVGATHAPWPGSGGLLRGRAVLEAMAISG